MNVKARTNSEEDLWLSLGRYLSLLVELGLLVVVIRQFQIESAAFLRLTLIAFGGFCIHSLLPFRLRLPFFLILSLLAVAVLFAPVDAISLVGVGLLLVIICHLPLPYWTRVTVLVATACVLAVLRVLSAVPWTDAVWPVLGSMFMFRMIVYLYDLRHESQGFSPWRSLSYFFLLPNVCFPLFPVVDYKGFKRNYYDAPLFDIYQTGIDWIVRGIIHLLIYRIIYQHLTLSPAEVSNPIQLVQFLIATFALYLRVSGQFHIIVGILHLFGFNLPETNHRYFLASSFTDFWRRINVYWKDFMVKIFYYPAYFKLRSLGHTTALILSTIIVFLVTWLLHSYQWFWLRGAFATSWQDVLFWGVLGCLVLANTLYEARYGRKRSLGAKTRILPADALKQTLKTAGTFATICVLWSLWTAESIPDWLSMWTVLRKQAPALASIGSLALLGSIVSLHPAAEPDQSKTIVGRYSLSQFLSRRGVRTMSTFVSLSFLVLLGIPGVYSQLGSSTATFIHSLRSGGLSRLDNARLERGYYERLLDVDRFNNQLWEVYMKRPLHWLDVTGTGLEKFRADFLQKELVPSFVASTSYGTVRTNRWGMRDKDYEQIPPPGTFRIALLGASTVMGWGVRDDETFESLLEQRLNSSAKDWPYARFEILNFGVPGYQPPQELMVLAKAFPFEPKAVFYTATGREAHRSVDYLAEVTRKGIEIPYEPLREMIRKAQIDSSSTQATIVRTLRPIEHQILLWIYSYFVRECRIREVEPVWILLPLDGDDPEVYDATNQLRIAQEAGFTILNVVDAFKGHQLQSLRLTDWDKHPNAEGHRLIAERLYDVLRANPAILSTSTPGSTNTSSGANP